jgi:hypothetical protein
VAYDTDQCHTGSDLAIASMKEDSKENYGTIKEEAGE